MKKQQPFSKEKSSILIATLIVSLFGALSGWAILGYQWYTEKPKIKGTIFTVLSMDGTYTDDEGTKNYTYFLSYIYLINTRENTVHILDYEMYIDTGQGFQRVKRVWGAQKIYGFEYKSNN